MIQEEKQLLLKDLCARLPYGVICKVEFKDSEGWKIQDMSLEGVFINECYFTNDTGSIYSEEFKPYLRPMSSMTKKEWDDFNVYRGVDGEMMPISNELDWLNEHHFDYRGLIKKGLAIEAPKDMYQK